MGKYMKIGKKVFGNGDRHGIGPEYYSRFIRKKDVPKVEQKYVDPMGKSSSVLLVGYSGPMVKGVPVYDRRGNLLEVIEDDDSNGNGKDKGWRSYGPGKYHSWIDQYVHDMTMEGADEEEGDVTEVGHWYGLLRGNLIDDLKKRAQEAGDHLTATERRELANNVGAIVTEDDQGFVWVDYYDNTKIMNDKWKEIQEEVAEFYKEQEEQ